MTTGNIEGLKRALKAAKEMLRPPPSVTPVEWAEKNIKIPVGNAIAGLVRFDNAPYQREVINQSINPDCYRISMMWSAQSGKTQTALCIQAYHIAMRPMPQMMMQPSQADLKTWLETKFNPMVEANETLDMAIAKPRARKGVNNSLMKSYAGGFLMFAWAGSPKTMRGRSAPIIVADEVDGYDLLPEGHPVGLLFQRAATFLDQRKLIEISTPTTKGGSYIESSFEAGDQRRFYVVCPHCNHLQTLRWDKVEWQGKEGIINLDTAPEITTDQYPETALYHCEGCNEGWNDGHRKAAIRGAERKGGGWIAAKPFRGHASYHLNELYSIFRRLRDVVQSYLDKVATNDLQTFVNVSLAETFEHIGEQANCNDLFARREEFKAQVPDGGHVLTAGVDMQPDRLEVEVVAWGEGERSWSVDYQIFYGDPLTNDPWDDLEEFLDGEYQTESGSILRIIGTAVDTGGTGGNTQAAYDWLAGKLTRKIFGIKGVGGWGRPVVSAAKKVKAGRKQRKIDLFLVGVDEAKKVVMRRLFIKKDTAKGYCFFPDSRTEEYFEQLTAEKLISKKNKQGFLEQEWHKMRDRNEALDCRVYAYAALKIINPSLKPKKTMLIQRKKIENDEPPEMEEVPHPPKVHEKENPPPVEKPVKKVNTVKIKRNRTNWVKKW